MSRRGEGRSDDATETADDLAGFLIGRNTPDDVELGESAAPELPAAAAIQWDSGGAVSGEAGADVIQALVRRLPNRPEFGRNLGQERPRRG